MIYVYSTLGTDQEYLNHQDGGADMPLAIKAPTNSAAENGGLGAHGGVLIKGGAGIADKRIETPLGIGTQVTEEQAEYLRANPVFRLHESNGFVLVSDADQDPEKVAADMAPSSADGSAPLTEADFPAEGSGPKVCDKKA